MNQRTVTRAGTFFISSSVLSLLLAAGGCSESFLLELLPKLGPVRLVGADTTQAFVVERIDAEEQLPFSVTPSPTPRDLLTVNLKSSEVAKPLSLTGSAALDVVADGDWIIWFDRNKGEVNALSRQDGRTSILAPDESWTPSSSIRAIDGDRVLLHRTINEYADVPTYQVIILNARTGDVRIVDQSWQYGTIAVEGDWLAVMNDEKTTVEILGLELSANIDLVNLVDGKRARIASNLRVSGSDPRVFIDNGRVLWQEFKNGGFDVRIRSYNPSSGKTETVLSDFNTENDDRFIVDAKNHRLLILKTRGNPLRPDRVQIETWSLDSRSFETLATFDNPNPLMAKWFETDPRFIPGYALWTDPMSGDLTAYDLENKSTRKFVLP